MKSKLLMAVAMGTVLVGCNQQSAVSDEPEMAASAMVLDSEEKRISYGMGIGLGQRIKQEPFGIDVDAFSQGVRDAVDGVEALMTQEEIMTEMQNFQQKQQTVAKEESEKAAETNKQEGIAFLEKNATDEGVSTTDSGLQYKVLTEGTGAKPGLNDTVEVNYAGTLIDGTEFDSSYKRGQSVSFPVSGVIPGWTEALQLMSVGSKWQLAIPSELAYGPGGTGGGPIGPNATLLFDVELIAIKQAAAE
ncbi:MAG: FKBP-type peptidyl-prolyl cis-trans isomerase [Oceanicoccus sp.]|jgi:FKBP-type peptidyl-prolyl cis-trans isomerase